MQVDDNTVAVCCTGSAIYLYLMHGVSLQHVPSQVQALQLQGALAQHGLICCQIIPAVQVHLSFCAESSGLM